MTDAAPPPQASPPAAFPAFDRAFALHQQGDLAGARQAYEEAVKENPDHVPSLVNLAVVLRRLGMLDVSLRILYQALEKDPRQPGLWQNLGETLRRMRRYDEAVASFKKASKDPTILLPAVGGMASALKDAGRFDEALQALEELVAKEPGNAAAWSTLSDALFDSGREEAALAAMLRTIFIKPNLALYRLRLAFQLAQCGRHADAEGHYRMLIADGAGKLAAAHVGLAQALISQGRIAEAWAPIEEARRLDPGLIDVYLASARAHFLAGDLLPAWQDYEWRKRHIDFTPPHLPVPAWEGQPLRGKKILLLGEQGAGDTIQFLRYVPLLAQLGGEVTLAISENLRELVASMPGLAHLVTDGSKIPQTDFYAHLLDLPAIFKTDLKSIPAQVPYLPLPPTKDEQRIKAPPGTVLKVGIAFQGNPRHRGDRLRSVDFETLEPLFGVEGVVFYSLQVGHPLPEAAQPYLKSGMLVDLAPRIKSFADTARLMGQLDLVISVDTSLVHLAGALKRPVWMLLPYAPDWRWLLERTDSPWYPSLRIFRQPRPSDWRTPAKEAAQALYALRRQNEAVVLPAAFRNGQGRPRFVMRLERALLADPGAAFLLRRESDFGGYEYATRTFLDAHLEPGDLFLDIGAHWGILSLHAASRWPGQVRALAVEPDPGNARRMKDWVALNGLAHVIEVVTAGCAQEPGRGRLVPGGNSTMGFSVVPDQQGGLQLVSVDSLLDERPGLTFERCFLKIDVEGLEPEVVAGASRLIASKRVAAIILERGRDYDAGPAKQRFLDFLDRLKGMGFRLKRFANEQLAGPLLPFVFTEDLCNFLALAPGFEEKTVYPRHGLQQVIAPTQAQRARLQGEAKIRRTESLMAAGASDAGFWADALNLQPLAEERAAAAAKLLAEQTGRLLDLGAGAMRLRQHLDKRVTYVPADLVPWSVETLAADLNQGQFPEGAYDAVAAVNVLEFTLRPQEVLAACRKAAPFLLLGYAARKEGEDAAARRANGWFNDFDKAGIEELLRQAGFLIEDSVEAPETGLVFFKARAA